MPNRTTFEAQIIARTISDSLFRRKLLDDPIKTLKSAGVDVPAGVSIKVVEDTAQMTHLVLPPVDSGGAIADTELESVAGGRCLETAAR